MKIICRNLCINGQNVLDMGTGTGVLPRNMYDYGAKWTATDISENQIEQAKVLSKDMDIAYYVVPAEEVDMAANAEVENWGKIGDQMGYFPFFVDISGKNGVIIGGGKVAARKVEKLLLFGPNLTVIAPKIEECMRTQEKLLQKDMKASLCFIERECSMEDLDGADFVIAATDDETLNGRISDYCKARGIPVNVVDDREKCSFFFPALVREGDLTIGISTDGRCPVAASWVRKEISRTLPTGIGDAVDLIGQMRPRVMELDVPEAVRKDILERMFLYCMEKDGEVTLEELMNREKIYEQNPDWYKRQ